MILASWYVSSYVISSRTVPELSVLTIEYGRSDDICFLRWVYENTVALMCLSNHSLSWIIYSGRSQFPCDKQPYGEDLVARNWALQPTARKELKPPAKSRRSEVESRFSSPSQAFRWLRPWPTPWLQPHGRQWTRTTQLNWVGKQIPDPKELCEINKSLLFWVCYAVIDN